MWLFKCCTRGNDLNDASTDSNGGNGSRNLNDNDALITNNSTSDRTDTPRGPAQSNSSANPSELQQHASPRSATKAKDHAREPRPNPERASNSMMQLAIEQRKVRRDQKSRDEMADHYANTRPKSSSVPSYIDNHLISNGSHHTKSNKFQSN